MVDQDPQVQRFKIGSSITLQTPTRSGYTFDYWLSNHDNNYNGSMITSKEELPIRIAIRLL